MEKIGNEKIEREKGYLYYVGANGQVYKTMRGKKGYKVQVSKMAVPREKGYLYFVNSAGYVSRAKMSRGKRARAR